MGFDLKKGWEIGFREKFGLSKWDIDTPRFPSGRYIYRV
jgi:hypothetical protein